MVTFTSTTEKAHESLQTSLYYYHQKSLYLFIHMPGIVLGNRARAGDTVIIILLYSLCHVKYERKGVR